MSEYSPETPLAASTLRRSVRSADRCLRVNTSEC